MMSCGEWRDIAVSSCFEMAGHELRAAASDIHR
jgi:hypothetical protein